jgi:hypothetical protein
MIARWFDHEGEIVEAPWVDGRQTAYLWTDARTHVVFGEQSETAWHQALTLCGKRALEIPGHGDVDCPECLEALAL